MGEQGKRSQIMEAAVRLFAEEGFDATSMQDIAREAGVAKGTMYLYFPSKDELIAQVYRHCYRMDVEACRAGLEQEKTALDKLCRRLDNIMDFALSHPLESRIERLYGSRPGSMRRPGDCLEELYEDIEAVVREGIDRGELKNLPSELLSQIYYGIATAMYLSFQADPERWAYPQVRSQCRKVIRDSLSADRD